MTNGHRAGKLFESIEWYRSLMEAAFAEGGWNVAVREAQEVVELSLKATLTFLLVDYPRIHDPAPFFVETLERRGIALTEVEVADVLETSDWLAKKRLPAFYEEAEQTEANATRAVEGARRIHELCLRITARPSV